MPSKQRTDRPTGGAEKNNDPEKGTMGLNAEPLCHQRRNRGEEAPMGYTVYDCEKIQHPRLGGKLQPAETDQKQNEAAPHHRFAAHAIDDQTADKALQHAHRSDDGEDTGGLHGGESKIAGMRDDVQHDDHQAEDQAEN